jgi:hypothetical protein
MVVVVRIFSGVVVVVVARDTVRLFVGELFFWPWALTRGDLTVELSEVLGAFQIR